jgi:thioredoxin 1
MSEVKHISDVEFDSEVTHSDVPVLVDFYATWCMPCQMLSPALDKLAGDFEGRVKFVKVDVDQEPHLAATHEISGVPTLKLFRGGSLVETVVGLPPLRSLQATLEKAATPARSSAV